jgi:hypothetical protein
MITADTFSLTVVLPPHIEFGIGTWFNRAVMSSQAFSRKLRSFNAPSGQLTSAQVLELRQWLANGMETPVPDFVGPAAPAFDSVVGAIYHLTDKIWIIPALQTTMANKAIGLVFDADDPAVSADALSTLSSVEFFPRSRLAIMHNKFLVAGNGLLNAQQASPQRLTCGSANYTTSGPSPNLVHTFASPSLQRVFRSFELLKTNPKPNTTRKWDGPARYRWAMRAFAFLPAKQPGDPVIDPDHRCLHAARSSQHLLFVHSN